MIEHICIILLVTLLFFAKTITYKYCSDDLPAVANPPKFKNKWQKRLLQLKGGLRVNPQEEHLITTVIHGLVCVFIYLAFGATDISFLAALLFCLNPINNQVSVWIAGRAYALTTLFMLMALTFPIVAPLFLLLVSYHFAGTFAPLALLGSKISWAVYFLPLIWAFHYRSFKHTIIEKIKAEMFDEDKKVKPQKLILVVKTFGFYLTHTLIPIKTTFYHSFLQSMAGNIIMRKRAYSLDRFFWIGSVSITGILYYWTHHPWDMSCFGLLWWCICIAPFCNLFRLSQEIAERYCYQANVGLMYFLAYFIIEVIGKIK